MKCLWIGNELTGIRGTRRYVLLFHNPRRNEKRKIHLSQEVVVFGVSRQTAFTCTYFHTWRNLQCPTDGVHTSTREEIFNARQMVYILSHVKKYSMPDNRWCTYFHTWRNLQCPTDGVNHQTALKCTYFFLEINSLRIFNGYLAPIDHPILSN